MGEIIEIMPFIKKGAGKNLLEEKPTEDEIIRLEVPENKGSKQTIRVGFKKDVLIGMVKKYSLECPVYGCNSYKDRHHWVCPSCHRLSDEVGKVVRRFVVNSLRDEIVLLKEEMVANKDREQKIFSIIFREMVDVAQRKIRKENAWGKELADLMIKENRDIPESLVLKSIYKAESKMRSEGWIPSKLWNELFDVAEKLHKRTDEEIKLVLRNSIPKSLVNDTNIEKAVSNICSAMRRHKKNLKKKN